MVPTILVVDDSDVGREAMCRILAEADLRIEIIEAQDGVEALPLALEGDVDIVISDIVMPKLDGIGLLRAIRKQRDPTSLPVILVTAHKGEDTREASFEAGVNDYLTRPYSAVELVSRVQVQLRLIRLQLELRRTNERHRRLGAYDELTGLPNRRHVWDLCRRELSRSRRHKFSMVVALVEVDDFRQIDKRVGHLVGDAIICELASVLEQELRTPDLLARVDAGKFCALLPQTDPEQGRMVCERLVSAVADDAFPGHDRGELTVRVGFTTFPGGRLESVDELMNAAEASLERAKENDRSVEKWSVD